MRRDGVGLFAAIIAVTVVAFFVQAWVVMLLLGALHHEVSDAIPAVSYGGSLLLNLALSLVVSAFRSVRS